MASAKKKVSIFLIAGIILFLIFWPKLTDPQKVSCDCTGFSTPSSCFGILSNCKYPQPQETQQEEQTIVSRKISDVDIAIVLDTSQSMRGEALTNAKNAIESLINRLSGDDRAAIIRFSDSSSLIQKFTSNTTLLKEKLNELTAVGRTNYLPALQLAAEQFVGSSNKKILIFISDGQPNDENRPYSILSEVETIADTGICIHTVGYGDAITTGSEAETILQESASISSKINGCGSYNLAPAEGLNAIFSDIYEEVSLGAKQMVEMTSPTNKTYNSLDIPVSFTTTKQVDCSYSLNNGNEITAFATDFKIKADSGKNLFVLNCGDVTIVREFQARKPYDLIGAFKDKWAQFDSGEKFELTDEETKEVLQKVMSEQNISGADNLINSLMDSEKKTKDHVEIHTKSEFKDGKTTIEGKISPSAELKDLSVYLDIPKCMAEKLNELVFYNNNFKIIADDPLIMWHFSSATEDVDFSIEVLNEIEEICKDKIAIIPIAGDIGSEKNNLFIRNLLPLLLIPIIMGIVLFSKELRVEDVEPVGKKSPNHWIWVFLILILFVAYPKDSVQEIGDEIRNCDCMGYDNGGQCIGLTHSCLSVEKEDQSRTGLYCNLRDCSTLENYILLDNQGKPNLIDLDITIILDRSKSMKGERMERAKTALKGLIELTNEDDRIALIRFDNYAQLVQQFTNNKELLKQKIDSIEVGRTTQYSPAFKLAFSNYLNQGSQRKKIIIFVSDGEPDDQGRPYSIFESVKELADSGICIHTVGYGTAITPGSAAETVLKGSAQLSNTITHCGEYHYAPQDEALLQEIFEDIYNEIMQSGALRIEPTVKQEDDAVYISASVKSNFNEAIVPGVSEFGCSPPAKVSVGVTSEANVTRPVSLTYNRERETYSARLSDIEKGKYQLSFQANSILSDGSACQFSGNEFSTINIDNNLGFVGCQSKSCGEVGNYLAFSRDFKTDVYVNITDTEFSPAVIDIADGTTVHWTNDGLKNHSVSGATFSSGLILPGEIFSYTFNDAGNFEYNDNTASLEGKVDSNVREEYAFGLNESVEVVLTIDTSGSMTGSRIEEAKNASHRFVSMLYRHDKASVVEFSDDARVIHPFSEKKISLNNAVDRLSAGGGTQYLPALNAAESVFDQFGEDNVKRMIIFLSDGQPWDQSTEAIMEKVHKLVDKGICVYTVGYGDEVGGKAEKVLQAMANVSKNDQRCGEYYYSVRNAAKLSSIFGEIYKEVLTLQSIMVNASHPSVINENENMTITARVKSRFNNNPVPGFSKLGSCTPPARMKISLSDALGRNLHNIIMEYSNGEYVSVLSDLEPGIYNMLIEANAVTATSKTCNFFGSYESSFIVTATKTNNSRIVFNLIIVFIVFASIVYLAVHHHKNRS